MTPLKIGLVGCGRWGRNILRDLIALRAQAYVVDTAPEAKDHARAAGAEAYGHIDSLPRDCAGFVVATPSVAHAGVIEQLLPRGAPIFVEKPFTTNVEDARRICAAAGERVFIMDKWRYHHGVEALAAMARSGELGKIQALRTQRVGARHPHTDVDPSWILLPHDLSIADEIIGHLPEPRAAWSGPDRLDMLAVLGGQGDVEVTMEIAANQPIEKRSVLVIGSHAVAQLDGISDDRILVAARSGTGSLSELRERAVRQEMPLLRELRCFLEHLRGGPPPRSPAANGLLVVERIVALRRLAGLEG